MDTISLRNEVVSLIDGDDIKLDRIAPGPSGWEDFAWLSCGKSKAFVFVDYRRPSTPIAKLMKNVQRALRAREAKRIVDEEILNSTVARFYA
jgi:hypothetical protein